MNPCAKEIFAPLPILVVDGIHEIDRVVDGQMTAELTLKAPFSRYRLRDCAPDRQIGAPADPHREARRFRDGGKSWFVDRKEPTAAGKVRQKA